MLRYLSTGRYSTNIFYLFQGPAKHYFVFNRPFSAPNAKSRFFGTFKEKVIIVTKFWQKTCPIVAVFWYISRKSQGLLLNFD